MNTNDLPSPEDSWTEIEKYRKRYGALPPRTELEAFKYVMTFKPSRNDICPCASGKKFKKCCGK